MVRVEWQNFKEGKWTSKIDVRDFIQRNYSEYKGDESFLSSPSRKTLGLRDKYYELLKMEKEKNGVLDIDVDNVSSLLSYAPGYMDKDNEMIVGFQTDAPLKRGVNPFGGIRMAEASCEAYGYELSPKIKEYFKYRTTHNDGVFRAYTPEMRMLRKHGILTGLPDAYGRGRIIGDYRRVALYGADYLIKCKNDDMLLLGKKDMTEENIRLREDVFRQIDFLYKLKDMAKLYGKDISMPAGNALECVQWIYFAYLAAIKEQNGAAMSLGRVSTFIDIYIERDLKFGEINEAYAQEIIDQFVLKLRMARQLRTPDYNELFAGDPTWVTEAVGGVGEDGRSLVSRTSYRFLHTLYNLLPSPEPNLTVLWAEALPDKFKSYCARVSRETCSIQYENDDVMRPVYGDDYGIACCVSAMKIGKQMQFFGARCNLPKVLLMTINGGRDELDGTQIGPKGEIMSGVLDYEKVSAAFDKYLKWLTKAYVNTMNIIHYMHDKYAYEKIQMALHDTSVERLMAFGAAGLSIVCDSLSAIKYAKVTAVTNESGLVTGYKTEGEFPCFGNDDDRVDGIANELAAKFIKYLRQTKAYRGAKHTLSLLTITSNVVYGHKTGATPCGRAAGTPFAPGANPMHGREKNGALASLNSVSKIDYCDCRDGVSNTFTLTPSSIGSGANADRHLAGVIGGYFRKGGHHLNVNVLSRETLMDAMEHPELYPNLTIRVSGYAVRFNNLSKEQQQEVIDRTYFDEV